MSYTKVTLFGGPRRGDVLSVFGLPNEIHVPFCDQPAPAFPPAETTDHVALRSAIYGRRTIRIPGIQTHEFYVSSELSHSEAISCVLDDMLHAGIWTRNDRDGSFTIGPPDEHPPKGSLREKASHGGK